MKKVIAGLLCVFIAILLVGTGSFAFDEATTVTPQIKSLKKIISPSKTPIIQRNPTDARGLGDLGKPPNYDQTIKRFRKLIPSFDTYADTLPTSWTGQYTTAKDQGYCGSCWAFATAGTMESKILMAGGPTYDLSEQELTSCNNCQYGCCGGFSTALMYWYRQGPMQESCTGYGDYTFICPGTPPPYFDVSCSSMNSCSRLGYYFTGYYTVDTSDPNEIKSSLYNDGPAYLRFNVFEDFSKPGDNNDWWEMATPGQVYTHTSGVTRGGHAVLIIGWDDSKSAWLCKNSWGASEGPEGDGTFWIAWTGHNYNDHDIEFGMANVQMTRTIQSWGQPSYYTLDGYVTGIGSTYFTNFSNGIYCADDFTVTRKWSINTISTEGFVGVGTLNNASNLNWYIYPDSSGVPAGYPGDGVGNHIWSHSCSPSDSEVTISGGDATLDVVTAKGSPINLEPGTYWLCFYPSLDYLLYDRWYWAESCTLNSQPAHLIDPGDLYGEGYTTWTSWQTVYGVEYYDAAFRLEGTVQGGIFVPAIGTILLKD